MTITDLLDSADHEAHSIDLDTETHDLIDQLTEVLE